jgi:hypothetical protein
MDLTLPFNALMWATGLAAVALSLNSIWAVLKAKHTAFVDWAPSSSEPGVAGCSLPNDRRARAIGDIHTIHASLQSVESALNDISRIEREIRRSEAASSLEIAITVAALKRVMKITRVTLEGSELRVEFDRTNKVSAKRIDEILSRPQ